MTRKTALKWIDRLRSSRGGWMHFTQGTKFVASVIPEKILTELYRDKSQGIKSAAKWFRELADALEKK